MRNSFGAKPILYPQPVFIIGSYSVLGKGKARLADRASAGDVRLSVSGWTMCPEVGG